MIVLNYLRDDDANSGFDDAVNSLRSGDVLSRHRFRLKGPDTLDVFTHTKQVFDANCTIQIRQPQMTLTDDIQSKVWLMMVVGQELYG
ncbi:hypothetical protein Q0F99_19270 [Rathayibacter oskolensis]|uniref:hypothetical protein n=1 Tax=Rathayibacter oskolensis TaxID=1891671 RepID=UPI0026602982|nr:hypothetical protein [Rathayibacter oskolensis]WKK71480.1 hypothetical protein Q0F99_19270 [Rathayibacter oskolensis]